jgi:hypothetical protein
VIWTSPAVRRVALFWQEYFRGEFLNAPKGFVEVVNLKPEKYAIAIGFNRRIADSAVMVRNIEVMELED